MVCVAAFIILCLVGIVVAFISIFKKEVGKKYLAVFKKAWHCVFKKVRLQKCDTNFKDDVKNTILKKVILKHPKWVKPLSVFIEIISVLIVVITVWSLVIAIKSLLALWVFGTCNVSKPSACSLASESCSIDAEEPKNIFEQIGQNIGQWGEIFGGIPDRLKTWGEDDFKDAGSLSKLSEGTSDKKAYNVMDPGCVVCMQSFRNQKSSGFFDKYETYLVIYPIKNPSGGYRFKNSEIASRFIIATEEKIDDKTVVKKLIDQLFTGADESSVSFQTRLNNDWNEEDVIKNFSKWLKTFGVSDEGVKKVTDALKSDEVSEKLEKNRNLVDNHLHVKSIPTEFYDGRKNAGLYKN